MVVLGADHGGVELKDAIKKHLEAVGVECADYGAYDTESIDYPPIAEKVARAVASGEFEYGFLFCGTGAGMSIAANKVKGIRAACCTEMKTLRHTRLHNDANILCLGGRILDEKTACEFVDVFLNTKFEGGRHQRRIDEITEIENR